MKNFIFCVFVWFLFQLVLLSGTRAEKSLEVAQGRDVSCEYKETLLSTANLGGVLFPITEFTFIKGDWCWVK